MACAGRPSGWGAAASSGHKRLKALVGTAKLNGLDPEACLRYVPGRLAEHPINRIDDLLPWNGVGDLPSFVANA